MFREEWIENTHGGYVLCLSADAVTTNTQEETKEKKRDKENNILSLSASYLRIFLVGELTNYTCLVYVPRPTHGGIGVPHRLRCAVFAVEDCIQSRRHFRMHFK